MIPLLQNYTLDEIIIFIAFFCVAIKEAATFYDWLKQKMKETFNAEAKPDEVAEKIYGRIETDEKEIQALKEELIKMQQCVHNTNDKITILLESDRDDNKSYLVMNYHYYCDGQGWIDDYTLDCIERRYKHYKDEGGNSFIDEVVMPAIRSLPHAPQK